MTNKTENGKGTLTTILPISLIIVILIQAGTLLYWMGSVNTRLENIELKIVQLELTIVKDIDRGYTQVQAEKDFLIRDKRLDKIELKIDKYHPVKSN